MLVLSSLSLLLIIGIVTSCVVVSVRAKSVWPIALLGALFVAGLLLLFLGRVRTSQQAVTRVIDLNQQYSRHTGRPSRSMTSWDAVDTKQFRTNIFPSVESAAKDIAKQIPTILNEMHGNSSELTKLKLQATVASTMPVKAVTSFQNELESLLPDVTFRLAESTNQPKTDDDSTSNSKDVADPKILNIELNQKAVSSATAGWANNEESESGTLSCAIQSIQGSRSISVDYIEKPWIGQPDQFMNTYPSRTFVVGVSPTLAESPEAADQSAFESLQHINLETTVNGEPLPIAIHESLIVDRFLQKLERPYGDVWRQAILLDLTGPEAETMKAKAIARLHRQKYQQTAQTSESWFHGLILIAVFAATAVIGVVLNLVTEGYFRGRIAATVTAFAIAAAIAFFIRMPW